MSQQDVEDAIVANNKASEEANKAQATLYNAQAAQVPVLATAQVRSLDSQSGLNNAHAETIRQRNRRPRPIEVVTYTLSVLVLCVLGVWLVDRATGNTKVGLWTEVTSSSNQSPVAETVASAVVTQTTISKSPINLGLPLISQAQAAKFPPSIDCATTAHEANLFTGGHSTDFGWSLVPTTAPITEWSYSGPGARLTAPLEHVHGILYINQTGTMFPLVNPNFSGRMHPNQTVWQDQKNGKFAILLCRPR